MANETTHHNSQSSQKKANNSSSYGPSFILGTPTITLDKLNGKGYSAWPGFVELWFLHYDHLEKSSDKISEENSQ